MSDLRLNRCAIGLEIKAHFNFSINWNSTFHCQAFSFFDKAFSEVFNFAYRGMNVWYIFTVLNRRCNSLTFLGILIS